MEVWKWYDSHRRQFSRVGCPLKHKADWSIYLDEYISQYFHRIYHEKADVWIGIHILKFWMYFTELIHNVILHHLFSESGFKSFWIIFKTRRFSLHSIYVQNNELNVWQRNNKSISLSYLFLFANILHF